MIPLFKMVEDSGIVVALTNDEYERIKEFLAQGTDVGDLAVRLDYSHVSQMGPGASENRNDCGAACAAVILRKRGHSNVTVDEIADRYQRKPNKPMWVSEVRQALSGYGTSSEYKPGLTPNTIEEKLREGKPIIALVSYPELPHQAINYDASHYIVVYGVLEDGSFLYHDPLSDGRELVIQREQMVKALQKVTKDNNSPNQGVIVL